MSQIESIYLLINHPKLNVNVKSKNDNTCLHFLALSHDDNIAAVQIILKMGIEIDAINNRGQTALMLAARQDKQNMVKALLDQNASTSLTCNKDLNASQYARRNACSKLITSFAKDVSARRMSNSSLTLQTVPIEKEDPNEDDIVIDELPEFIESSVILNMPETRLDAKPIKMLSKHSFIKIDSYA
jgi:ankyrin repeat protein